MHTNDDLRAIRDEVVTLMTALRRFSFRFCRNDNEADDLVQETILKALSSVHLFHRGTSLKSWMFTIMRNTHATYYVREKRCSVGVDGLEWLMPNVAFPQEWAIRAKEVEAATALLRADARHL